MRSVAAEELGFREALEKVDMERDLVSDIAKIYQVWKAYAAAIREGDLERWLTFWSSRGIRMAPEQPRRVGLEQIRQSIEPQFREFHFEEFVVQPDEVRILGDHAYSHGSIKSLMSPRSGGAPLEENIKFLTILTRGPDGSWRITLDCFNTNGPSS